MVITEALNFFVVSSMGENIFGYVEPASPVNDVVITATNFLYTKYGWNVIHNMFRNI